MKTSALSPRSTPGSGRPSAASAEDRGADPSPDAGGGLGEHVRSGLGLLQCVIRETGISDSAAAVRLGMSTSTVSRWKMEHPEVRAGLQQAREECRALKLGKVLAAAEAEEGRGWRAAAWFLERVFPADYSPRQLDRCGFQQMDARRAAEELEADSRLVEKEANVRRREYEARARELEAEIRMLELEARKRELEVALGVDAAAALASANRVTGMEATPDKVDDETPDFEAEDEAEDEDEDDEESENEDESAGNDSFYSESDSHSSRNPRPEQTARVANGGSLGGNAPYGNAER